MQTVPQSDVSAASAVGIGWPSGESVRWYAECETPNGRDLVFTFARNAGEVLRIVEFPAFRPGWRLLRTWQPESGLEWRRP